MFVVNLFIAARAAISGWLRRERAYDELMALDDRSLADIGVNRSEIQALVYGAPETPAARTERMRKAAEYVPAQARLAGGHRWFPFF